MNVKKLNSLLFYGLLLALVLPASAHASFACSCANGDFRVECCTDPYFTPPEPDFFDSLIDGIRALGELSDGIQDITCSMQRIVPDEELDCSFILNCLADPFLHAVCEGLEQGPFGNPPKLPTQ